MPGGIISEWSRDLQRSYQVIGLAGSVDTERPAGFPIVRFFATSWTELCWQLYQWGDAVEVLAPEALRQMVEGHRRAHFYPVLP
jgi:predicted DNA-binding transcriptional regulator YafY